MPIFKWLNIFSWWGFVQIILDNLEDKYGLKFIYIYQNLKKKKIVLFHGLWKEIIKDN